MMNKTINGIEFEPVKGNEMYYLSKCGQVYTSLKKRLLVQHDNNGYKQVFLSGKWNYIHRLVCMQWLGNSDLSLWVNHKDGNKANNHLSNLEWTTISQNIVHAHDTGLIKRRSGADHWRTGVCVSQEVRNKMSKGKLGKLHPKFTGYYHTPFGEFESANQAGIAGGISAKQIIQRCKSWTWKERGYTFEPA